MTDTDAATAAPRSRWTRLEYHPTETGGVELRSERDGLYPHARVAVRKAGSGRAAVRVAALLNAALREGAAYGPIDDQVELADLLLHRPDPAGRVRYELTAAFGITRGEGATTTTVDLPRLGSKTAAVEVARELDTAFRIGGEDPHAVPPAPVDTPDPGDVLAGRVAALAVGQRLLEVGAAGAPHLAVESADGILCDCGRAAGDRFRLARLHMPGGRSRSRRMPEVREVAAGAQAVTS
jgi:hypothetical protein